MPLLMLLLASVLLTAYAVLGAPFGPLGGEFQVNTYTTGNQGFSAIAVAADPAGNFVVVWDRFRDDAQYWRIANPTAQPGCPAP